jgi:MFS family permease
VTVKSDVIQSGKVGPERVGSEDAHLDQATLDGEPVNLPAISPDRLDDAASILVASNLASKAAIRTSLKASTLDGVFATIFSNITGGVLLSNFLVELHASPTEIGLLTSIPLVANLLQPLGAWLGDRTRSRHYYCLWVYGPSRLIWLALVAGIVLFHWQQLEPQVLVTWTLAILCVTHFVGALGSAAWLSWLAALVPRRLRGRYFGVRNRAANLANLLCVPLIGWSVSAFPDGPIEGFGIMLVIGVAMGVISLGFQFFIVDVNPQDQKRPQHRDTTSDLSLPDSVSSVEGSGVEGSEVEISGVEGSEVEISGVEISEVADRWFQDRNFLLFLLYFSCWTFAVNLSAPFFNLYMLDSLAIDLRWVTMYNSLQAAANLLMLVFWGKLADRVGNRAVLLGVGVLVAVTPLLWLGAGANPLSLWVVLPLLHVLAGGTWAAIDLCNNNLQLGVAPVHHQASYFAIAAAIAGVSGALGTTAGGFLLEFANYGGLPGLFVLSAGVRLLALGPLALVHEERGHPLRRILHVLFPHWFADTTNAVPAE